MLRTPIPSLLLGGLLGWLTPGAARAADMPAPVAERLRKEVAAALADPAVRAKLEKAGSTVAPVYGDAFRKQLVDELAQWREIGREQNIVLE